MIHTLLIGCTIIVIFVMMIASTMPPAMASPEKAPLLVEKACAAKSPSEKCDVFIDRNNNGQCGGIDKVISLPRHVALKFRECPNG